MTRRERIYLRKKKSWSFWSKIIQPLEDYQLATLKIQQLRARILPSSITEEELIELADRALGKIESISNTQTP